MLTPCTHPPTPPPPPPPPPPLQGRPAIDYARLQALALPALRSALADAPGLHQAQAALQLALAGRLQALADAAQPGGGGGEATDGGAGAGADDASGGAAGGSPAAAEGIPARLLDSGDAGSAGSGDEGVVEEEVVEVAPAERDAAFAARLGAYALAAVEAAVAACAAAGLPGALQGQSGLAAQGS